MNIAVAGNVVPGICVCVPYPPGPYPATGTITSTNNNYLLGGIPVANNGSLVMFPCGTSVIISINQSFINPLPVARTGDSVNGCGNGSVVGTGEHICM